MVSIQEQLSIADHNSACSVIDLRIDVSFGVFRWNMLAWSSLDFSKTTENWSKSLYFRYGILQI